MLVRLEMLTISILTVSLITWSAVEFVVKPTLAPEPYGDVAVTEIRHEEDRVHIVATFEKYDCTFQRLDVIWGEAGLTGFLNWADDDGLEHDDNRIAGRQTLRLAIDLEGRPLDWFEIRTRHDCDGVTVDRTFAHIDLPVASTGFSPVRL